MPRLGARRLVDRPTSVGSINEPLNLRHAELLAHVDIFARLDRVALARLAAHVELLAVEIDSAVCREREPDDSLYVVVWPWATPR